MNIFIFIIRIIFHVCLFRRHGLPDNIDLYGLVSGLWASTFALGAFFGPSISGMLYDSVGFRKAVIFVIVLHLIVGSIVLITLILEKKPQPYKELDASEPLLRDHERLFREKSWALLHAKFVKTNRKTFQFHLNIFFVLNTCTTGNTEVHYYQRTNRAHVHWQWYAMVWIIKTAIHGQG